MNQVRPLTTSDLVEIERLITSRAPIAGVSWTPETIIKEVGVSPNLGLFKDKSLEALVLYKDIGTVLEILLIFSKKGSSQSGFLMLDALLAAHSQVREVWLEVHEDNSVAIEFYERQRFERVSARSGYYSDGKQAINYNLFVSRTPG